MSPLQDKHCCASTAKTPAADRITEKLGTSSHAIRRSGGRVNSDFRSAFVIDIFSGTQDMPRG